MGHNQQSLFVNEDGLFKDDRAVHQTLLHSRYARFHRLDTVVSHLEPSASGELVLVNVKVHCETGAARIKSVDTQLAQMDPGFMVPMPHFL